MNWKSAGMSSAALFVIFAVGPQPGLTQQRHPDQPKTSVSNKAPSPAPGHECAFLPISLLEKTFGQKFEDEPMKTPMPPAYDGAAGTTCRFSPQPPFTKAHPTVDFTIFVEASAAKAKETFDKAGAFFADKSKPAPSGLGDEAYWQTDSDEPQLHVLKGKAHYSLGIEPANDGQLVGLARAITARL